MKLADLLQELAQRGQLVEVVGRLPTDVESVTTDSRCVAQGALFCAIDGLTADGHDYVSEAVKKGAVAALVCKRCPVPVPQILVGNSRIAASVAAATYYRSPAADLRVVGVTGTNGKSTTVAYLHHMLNSAGTAGSVGTLGSVDGAGEKLADASKLTTPDPVSLHRTLADLHRRGVRTVAMEVSSHALDQKRMASVGFHVGVYTNITHEHLDYHGDLGRYLESKLSFSDYVLDGGAEVVNGDVTLWRSLEVRPELKRITYGMSEGADVRAKDVRMRADGTSFDLELGGARTSVAAAMIGEFNVSNALAASAAAWAMGMSPSEITARLVDAPPVPGRMEVLTRGSFVIVRDYAHTPDAYRLVLGTLRQGTRGRLVIVFGCGGDRDRSKRSEMGRIAAELADVVILTTDNPRTEDPERIVSDIEEGMQGVAHMRVAERAEAINRAIGLLREGDTLLLAGKGHEDYQLIGTERIPFDEAAVVREALVVRGTE